MTQLLGRFASRQVRNRGTLVGNIANSSPIADTPPLLLVLDAQLILQRGQGQRTLALADFYLDYKKTALEGGEFIHKTKAVEHYGLPFMNALNNLQLPKMFAEGGYVAPVTASSISQQVSDGVSELVSVNENRSMQVVNVEQDFSNLQNKVNNVESARTY